MDVLNFPIYLAAGAAGAALVGLLVLVLLWRWLRRPPAAALLPGLEERLAEDPPPRPSSGDRRLTVDGVPVRLRLAVLAPAGASGAVDPATVDALLDRTLPGLGEIAQHDKPRVRVWPTQLSYQGFAHAFFRHVVRPEPDGELSPWVLLAGRVRVGKAQFMLGLALQAIKPNGLGRRTLDAHEWDTALRIRVREA
jgi:hypothetical protein